MVKRNCELVIFMLLCVQVYCFPQENDAHIVYDQKQSGKFNIHINIKDVAIIDVNSNEFIDDTINDADEYYYDEDDLTVKPLFPWLSSTPYDTMNYSPNYTFSTKAPMHQFSTTGSESNTLNSTTLIHHTTVPNKENLDQLATQPVLNQNSSENNIPLSPLNEFQQNIRANENDVISKFQPKRKPNSSILDILSGQIFNKSIGCKGTYGYKNNRNCRKKKHSTLIKGLLGLMELMKVKDN